MVTSISQAHKLLPAGTRAFKRFAAREYGSSPAFAIRPGVWYLRSHELIPAGINYFGMMCRGELAVGYIDTEVLGLASRAPTSSYLLALTIWDFLACGDKALSRLLRHALRLSHLQSL